MKRSTLWLLLLPVSFLVCKAIPPAEETPAAAIESIYHIPNEPEPEPEPEEEPSGTITVSQEVYDFTLTQVTNLVDHFNAVINNKNYLGWKEALSEKRYEEISSPEFLERMSESPTMRNRRIVLKTPNDYFLYVVVPSRATANARVDEIEFITEDRVKVFFVETGYIRDDTGTLQTESRRIRLYEMTKSGDTWKIDN